MTEPTETPNEEDPISIDVGADDVEEPATDVDEPEPETEALEPDDGPRAIAFETATETLASAFEIDGRQGETITDFETIETEEGRQLVATVETSRSTMLSHRLASAKRTGRRAGIRAAFFGALAAIVYAVVAGRRRFGGSDPVDEVLLDDDTTGDEALDE